MAVLMEAQASDEVQVEIQMQSQSQSETAPLNATVGLHSKQDMVGEVEDMDELPGDFLSPMDSEGQRVQIEMVQREKAPSSEPVDSYPFPKSQGVIRPYNVNPFENDASCLLSEWIRCCVVAVTLFPLRLVVLLVSLVCGGLFITIAGLGFEKASYKPAKGVSWPRTLLLKPVRLCCRGIMFAFGFWWIKEDFEDSEAEAAVLVVASHCSMFDLLYFVYAYQPMFLCHTAVRDVPFLGKCAYLMEAVFVDRQDETSRREALTTIDQCLTRSQNTGSTRRPMLFFPEGAWTNGQCIISFKTAAFRLGFPVLPFALSYPHANLNIAGVGRAGNCFFMFRMMMQVYNSMHVQQLSKYAPTPKEIKDPSLFAENVRQVLARRLELDTSAHSHEDSYLMELVQDSGYHLRNACSTLDVASVQRHCDISMGTLLKLLRGFKELHLDRTGRLPYDGFLEAAALEEDSYSRNLFVFLDPGRTSVVSFVDFVQKLTVIKNKQAPRLRMQLAYLLCNSSGSGMLTLGEMDEACTQAKLSGAKKALCMQELRATKNEDDTLSFEAFAQVLDRNRELLNWFLLSPSNPLLKLVKWH